MFHIGWLLQIDIIVGLFLQDISYKYFLWFSLLRVFMYIKCYMFMCLNVLSRIGIILIHPHPHFLV